MDNSMLLMETKKLLSDNFPDKVYKIILFGSHVNGIPDTYSDYDILVILNNEYDWKLENTILEKFYRNIDLKFDILTNVKVISKSLLNTSLGKQPYIQNALKYGIVA